MSLRKLVQSLNSTEKFFSSFFNNNRHVFIQHPLTLWVSLGKLRPVHYYNVHHSLLPQFTWRPVAPLVMVFISWNTHLSRNTLERNKHRRGVHIHLVKNYDTWTETVTYNRRQYDFKKNMYFGTFWMMFFWQQTGGIVHLSKTRKLSFCLGGVIITGMHQQMVISFEFYLKLRESVLDTN